VIRMKSKPVGPAGNTIPYPDITPLVAEFGRKIAARGMTAVLPDLFGTPGREVSIGYVLGTFAKICVNKEFTLLATALADSLPGEFTLQGLYSLSWNNPRFRAAPKTDC